MQFGQTREIVPKSMIDYAIVVWSSSCRNQSSRKTKDFLSTCAATVCVVTNWIPKTNGRQEKYRGGRVVARQGLIQCWRNNCLQHSRKDEDAFLANVVHLHHKQQIILFVQSELFSNTINVSKSSNIEEDQCCGTTCWKELSTQGNAVRITSSTKHC